MTLKGFTVIMGVFTALCWQLLCYLKKEVIQQSEIRSISHEMG